MPHLPDIPLRSLTSALLLAASLSLYAADAPVRMGISGFAIDEHRSQIVEATERAILPLFEKDGLEVKSYTVKALEEAVLRGEVDIILSSAGFARRVVASGVRPIATIVSPSHQDPNANEGSVFIVREDRKDLRTLADLRGKRMAANLSWGFSGYHIALGEIADLGFDPDRFFSERLFVGRSDAMTEIARAVATRRTDVGVLRLCAWEMLPSDLRSELRIVNEKTKSEVACRVSTELYPAQSLSVTPRVDAVLAREMVLRLLQMPPTESGRAWSIASDFHHVDELLKKLRLGPYAYLREWSLNRFMAFAWPWLMLGAVLILGLIWHSRRTERLLNERGMLLQQLYEKESLQNEQLSLLQRSNTVNQLSSLVAHELRQPLAALTLYADGIAMALEKGSAPIVRLLRFSEGITREAKKASDIVESVRSYAKNETQPREALSAQSLAQEAVRLFQLGKAQKTAVETHFEADEKLLFGNKLELTLVLVNLLKNAREAALKSAHPKILFSFAEATPEHLTFRVADTGEGLSDEALRRLGNPVQSGKTEGLGLGLSIVRMLVESHGGSIAFSQSDDPGYGGLAVDVTLPTLKPADTSGTEIHS